jgi:hypothetical protein
MPDLANFCILRSRARDIMLCTDLQVEPDDRKRWLFRATCSWSAFLLHAYTEDRSYLVSSYALGHKT